MVMKIFNSWNALGNREIYLNNSFKLNRSTKYWKNILLLAAAKDALDVRLKNKWKVPEPNLI